MKRTTPMRALAVVAAATLLTGCVKLDMQLDVGEDDTIAGEMVLAISRDVSALAESMGEDPTALLGEMDQDLPDGTEVEEYEDGDYVGQRYVFEDVPLDEFNQGEEFSIVHEGEEIVVEGVFDLTDFDPEAMGGDLGGLEDQLGADAGQLGDLNELMESFELNISITFPGEVTEHNGELDGTTVSWTPVPGEANEISARSADSGGGGGDGIPVWVWILIIVVVLGLAGLLFALSRNPNKAPPADADAAPAADAGAGAVPPPPAGTEPPTVQQPFGSRPAPEQPAPEQPTRELPTPGWPAAPPPGPGEQEPPAPPR